MKKQLLWVVALGALMTVSVAGLSGCAVQQVRQDQMKIAADAQASLDAAPTSRPVVVVHEGAWLLGERIQASKPQPEIFDKQVVFKESGVVSLQDIADWLEQAAGVRVKIDPSVNDSMPGALRMGSQQARSAAPLTLKTPLSAFAQPAPLAWQVTGLGGVVSQAPPGAPISYVGGVRGFINVVDGRFAVFSRYQDGTVTFFRTETRTFALPSLADASAMSGSISTAGTSASTDTGSAGAGQSMMLKVQSNPMATILETAKAIAGQGAEVVIDENLGILAVTGTPIECDRIATWVHSLDEMFSKQIAIDVHVYQVQLSREDNYGLNLSLAYQSSSGHTGLSLKSASAPTIESSATPMTFGATIVGGSLNGTTAAVTALSTLGNVSQLVSRSGVTQNGKVLALQSATEIGYVAQTQTTLTPNVGSTSSMQTATLVPGFTSSFLPKVVDGRILMDFDMTLSDLVSLTTFTSGSGTSQTSVQLPTLQTARFEQSVSLKPGETLVLTGLRQQRAAVTNNGVGVPEMVALGGGVDAQKGDNIIAVVISARLL